jgi:glycerophosphoryl diester phosphodiesterase
VDGGNARPSEARGAGAGQPVEGRGRRFLARGPTLGVAHRGASRYAPENTLAAFRLALEHGVPAVECDVRRTQDGHLVVIHDPAVDRTTDGHGAVASLTLESLRRLDAGRWFGPEFAGERIPLLEEVLEAVRGRALIKIEIKNDPIRSEGIEQQVAGAIRRHRMEDEALVMSFDHHIIRELRGAAPGIATGIIYSARLVDPIVAARGAGADALCVEWGYLDRDLVDIAHQAGLGVFAWTVDDEQDIRRFTNLGVDGITSNDTRLLTRLLAGGP